METVILQREPSDQDGTFGAMFYQDEQICLTCEDPWNNNEVGNSCIPAGKYEVAPYKSAKYPNAWILKDVPGRSLILIHNGNTKIDTRGCILVGSLMGFLDGLRAVLNSKNTLKELKEILPDSFLLEIHDAAA